MNHLRKISGAKSPGENDLAKMMNWPRQLLAIQTAVSAAGDDVDRVLGIVLQNAVRMAANSDGGEIELRQGHEFVCRSACGSSPRKAGERTPVAGIVPGFCSISAKDGSGDGAKAGNRAGLRSSISAPIPFKGEHVGLLRLHSRTAGAFSNRDLLALQLLAGIVTQGLARGEHAKGERARAEADRRFQATFDQAAVGISHVAPDGRFIMVNDKFCDIAGWEREELIARGFQGITHPDDLDIDIAHAKDLLAGRIASYAMEKRYIRSDGSPVWINLTVALVRKPDGRPHFFVSTIEDISARRAAEADAVHDPLTGLLNRRGALAQLKHAMSEQGAWQHGVAAAFIDLDGFKAVNDTFGHDEGDRCLIKIAAGLRKALRSDDVIARMGGDEFLALFPASSEEAVKDVLLRIQREIDCVAQGESWSISASLGVALVPPGAQLAPNRVIAEADRLMYRAKQSGDRRPLVATVPRTGSSAAAA
ncbi:MAG: diguanylate cyclase [Candidatus Andeanibacterium colombiense]|uniref:Diguanylate cyclase n=1 Tax=Candidatus Andeanibacterium colombiense TaxID=3121345 RepID=A0AAJ5X7D8_9SPHN|nr:MAG: diguanylate cyclase [Sphingomonadaceae bacterium]